MRGKAKRGETVRGEALDSREKSLLCAQLARDRRAQDLIVLELGKLVSYTDYFVICTGRSDRQVKAISEHLETELKRYDIRPRSIEGAPQGRWVLMDYGDVIVHIFQKAVRELYDLEGLWSEAEAVALPREPDVPQGGEVIEEDEDWEDGC